MFADSLKHIEAEFDRNHNAEDRPFGSAHLLFIRIDDDFESAHKIATEHLSKRYAMDFSKPARRYSALGKPADVAEVLSGYYAAGVRHFVLDLVGPLADRQDQLNRFAKEVQPLLSFAV